MKRIFDTRSKSAETLGMVAAVPSFGAAVEPQCKKQRQSVIKQSVKRLFGSVKRLLPSSHRRKDKIGLEDATSNLFFAPQEIVKKSAAIQEAESFMARLGSDWTISQVQERISYLYRLVNDAFERAYQQTVKDKIVSGPSQNVNDYMTEIRKLQAMINDRQQIEVQAEETSCVTRQQLSYSSDQIASIPAQRSSSVDICQQTQTLQPQYEFIAITPAITRPFSPVPPTTFCQPDDFNEGMEWQGVKNKVSLGPFYTLSHSNVNVPAAERSESRAEVYRSMLNVEQGYEDLDQQRYEPVNGVQPGSYKDEEMESLDEIEAKIELFERISKSGLCSVGSIGHERQHSNISLPNLSRPRSFEQSQDHIPINHAYNQSLGCIPIGNAVMQMLNLPQTTDISNDFYVVEQSDCSSRRCSVRELAKIFENTTL